MSSTPRKSSIRSRAPLSLRLPSQSRKVSNPHLSLVFAQGDAPGTLQLSSLSGLPASEEALSRQLDGDLGGRQMGLRSRRSSSATVRTVRTGGMRSPSPTASVKEEAEEEAGPSTLLTPELPPSTTDTTHTIESQFQPQTPINVPQQRLNPKASSSWLRWNSPAPSFPRSVSTERAKGKRPADTPVLEESRENVQLTANATEPSLGTVDPAQPGTPHPPTLDTTAGLASGPSTTTPDTFSDTTSRGRSWWTRTQVQTKAHTELDGESVKVKMNQPANEIANELAVPLLSDQPTSHISPDPALTNDVVPLPSAPGPVNPASSTRSSSQARDGEPRNSGESKRGWKGYLAWSAGDQKSQVPLGNNAATQLNAPLPIPTGTENPRSEPAEPLTHSVEEGKDPATESPRVEQPKPSAKPGWGIYLYSYIAPTPNSTPAVISTASITATPENPSLTEPPPQPSPDVPQAEEPKSNAAAPVPALDSIPASSKDNTAASTSGWLNYLAFRAGQKKIASPSVVTGETAEEVMDFSADPEFPDASPNGGVAGAESGSAEGSKASRAAEKKPATNLAIRKKRLSVSSARSANSVAALSSSPGSVAAPNRSSSSALPPPPAPPAVQPNLLIPTFEDIFDRPPRSLPPPTSMLGDQKSGSLAWRALAVAGSYVYGQKGSSEVDEKETRGKGAAKNVGMDLPRRVGIGGGDQDEGWKRVTRVVVVGVHGWFPAKMLNSVIGEPTGTSQKFASMMGQAVRKFFADKGVDEANVRLTLMPLEGEGTIDGRVDRLYKAYLSNPAWINDLRRADAVFFAAHSQGCIVTTHLVSRMIAQGHLRTPLNAEAVSRCEWAFGPIGVVPDEPRNRKSAASPTGAEGGYQKVAMLAMCGVHLGPLHSISTSTVIQPYLQWFENAAARELFEFQDTTSAVSLAYQKALGMCLENGARVVLVAGLNDQVVPIYGATFSTATHPLLLRALFVDGASYSRSDFMTNLLAFALLLRNAGLDDQRLVEHLSEATAGSLIGIGHSTPYEDPSCYKLAVDYLFHAGPAASPMPPLQVEPFAARDARNDFELPWIMRALVDSPEIKDLFPTELKELKEGIVAWRPSTKALKEIKRRLEPMAGRQSRLRPLQTSASSTSLAGPPAAEGLGTSPAGAKGHGLGLKRDW